MRTSLIWIVCGTLLVCSAGCGDKGDLPIAPKASGGSGSSTVGTQPNVPPQTTGSPSGAKTPNAIAPKGTGDAL